MANLLQQLENNEAVLQMYLAGELDAEDHAEVEQLLSADGGLRHQRDELQALQGMIFPALARLDVIDQPAASEQVRAARAVGRAVTRRQVEHDERPAAAPAARRPMRIGVGRWAYPVAAAAALLVGFVTWVALTTGPAPSGRNNLLAIKPVESHEARDLREPHESHDALDEAEAQLAALNDRGDDPANLFGPTLEGKP